MQINSKTPTKRILKAVRALAEVRGHVKGVYVLEKGGDTCNCLVGLVNTAVTGEGFSPSTEEQLKVTDRVIHALAMEVEELEYPGDTWRWRTCTKWNDRPETTKADILALLDRAIQHA